MAIPLRQNEMKQTVLMVASKEREVAGRLALAPVGMSPYQCHSASENVERCVSSKGVIPASGLPLSFLPCCFERLKLTATHGWLNWITSWVAFLLLADAWV